MSSLLMSAEIPNLSTDFDIFPPGSGHLEIVNKLLNENNLHLKCLELYPQTISSQ
jgi:hypothetical protein